MYKIYSFFEVLCKTRLLFLRQPCGCRTIEERTAIMKQLFVKNVSADQAGDYFQVHFDNDEGSSDLEFDVNRILNDTSDYFLIQWGLEYDDEEEPLRYIESNDDAYCGHVTVLKGSLTDNSAYLKVRFEEKTQEIELSFPALNGEAFKEMERILKIIVPNLVVA